MTKITIEIQRSQGKGMYDVSVADEGGITWWADELPSAIVLALAKSELTDPDQATLAQEIADAIEVRQ